MEPKKPIKGWKNKQGEMVDRFSDWGEDTIEIIYPNKEQPVVQQNPKQAPPVKKKK